MHLALNAYFWNQPHTVKAQNLLASPFVSLALGDRSKTAICEESAAVVPKPTPPQIKRRDSAAQVPIQAQKCSGTYGGDVVPQTAAVMG